MWTTGEIAGFCGTVVHEFLQCMNVAAEMRGTLRHGQPQMRLPCRYLQRHAVSLSVRLKSTASAGVRRETYDGCHLDGGPKGLRLQYGYDLVIGSRESLARFPFPPSPAMPRFFGPDRPGPHCCRPYPAYINAYRTIYLTVPSSRQCRSDSEPHSGADSIENPPTTKG